MLFVIDLYDGAVICTVTPGDGETAAETLANAIAWTRSYCAFPADIKHEVGTVLYRHR